MQCVRFAEVHRTEGATNFCVTVAEFQNTKRCRVQIMQRVDFWSRPSKGEVEGVTGELKKQ